MKKDLEGFGLEGFGGFGHPLLNQFKSWVSKSRNPESRQKIQTDRNPEIQQCPVSRSSHSHSQIQQQQDPAKS
jgi:hypothetical protein